MPGEFVRTIERFVPAGDGAVQLRAGGGGRDQASPSISTPAPSCCRAAAPGLPGSTADATFYLQRAAGAGVRLVSR